MDKWKKYTVIFIICAVLAIAIYDVVAIQNGGIEASISHTFIEWSYKMPAFTFLFGFVMGHLFWRMGDTKATAKIAESLKKEEPQK